MSDFKHHPRCRCLTHGGLSIIPHLDQGCEDYNAAHQLGIRLGEQRATQKIVAWLASDTDQGMGQYFAHHIEQGEHLRAEHTAAHGGEGKK